MIGRLPETMRSITGLDDLDPSSFDRLPGGDALFLDVESDWTRMFVAVCLLFEAAPLRRGDGSLDFDRIRRRVASRLESSPRYRQRLERSPLEGRPIWVDDAGFDLDRHVHFHSLASGGRMHQLETFCGERAAEDLDRSHPLWQLWVIDGVRGDRVALLMKAHHCMVDGIAGMQLLESVLDVEPTEESDPVGHWQPSPTPGRLGLALLEASERWSATRRLVSDARAELRRPGELALRATELARGLWHAQRFETHPASDSPLNHPASADRRCAWSELDLERVEAIRRAKGGTVNDVVVAAVCLALGRMLVDRGFSRESLQERDFRVACPVDTRSSGGDRTAANQISLMVAPIPVGEPDPLRVLDAVREALAEAKDSQMVGALETVLGVSEWIPKPLARGLVRLALAARSANLVVTNVPGPPVPLYLLGSRLLAAYPIVPLMPGHSLCVAVLSYAGRLHWGLNADWQAIPELADWIRALEESFEALHEAALREAR